MAFKGIGMKNGNESNRKSFTIPAGAEGRISPYFMGEVVFVGLKGFFSLQNQFSM